MGRRGPSPEPTRLRVLKGNTAHRPLPVGEPHPPSTMPPCPSWLPIEAKREWRSLAPKLHRLKLLTSIDGLALTGLCLAVAQLRTAQAVIDSKGQTFTTPSGYKQQRPEVGIVNRSLALIAKFSAEFGLTPSARSRISLGEEGGAGGDALGILS